MARPTAAIPLESLRAEYDIANRQSRFRRQRKGVSTVGTSGDYHYRSEADFLYTIELGRDFDRNDPIAGVAIDRLCSNVLREGIGIEPDTGWGKLDDAVRAEFEAWANDPDRCDLAGEHTFRELEQLALRSVLVDGDIFALPNETNALELIEAHRCRTPSNTSRNVVHGVLLSETRKRLEYWFTRDEIDPSQTFAKVSDAIPVKARDRDGNPQVFHVYNPNRISQTRGVSVFRAVADMLGMHGDIQFANLVKQQCASVFGVIRKRPATAVGLPGNQQLGARTVEPSIAKPSRVIENLSPGVIVTTDPGEDWVPFAPQIHSAEFFDHVMLVLKIIAANLNLPVHSILLDASQTNFSGWRGAVDQAKDGYRRIQNWFCRRFHAPIYQWQVRAIIESTPAIRKMVSHERVINPYGVEFQFPVWDYIDPAKDAAADIARITGGTDSPRAVVAARGKNIDVIRKDTLRDNANYIRWAKHMARKLNEDVTDDSERVTWRDLLVLPGSPNLAVNLSAEATGSDAKRRAAENGEANV